MAKLFAEFVGTLILVLFGCGAAVLGGEYVAQLDVALAFGFAIVALAYSLGPISGGHVNPAVTLATVIAGRMPMRLALGYWAAQLAGAIAGAALIAAISGQMSVLGQNGWGPGYMGEFDMLSAWLFEMVMTAVFVAVVLGATGPRSAAGFAGLAIGLTLSAIHIVGIQVTGVSVNPARSFGPAVLVGGQALHQLWLFILAPAVGAVIGAAPFRYGLFESRVAASTDPTFEVEPVLSPEDGANRLRPQGARH